MQESILIVAGPRPLFYNFFNYFVEQHPEYRIVCYGRNKQLASLMKNYEASENCVFVTGNAIDSSKLRAIFKDYGITRVVYFADARPSGLGEVYTALAEAWRGWVSEEGVLEGGDGSHRFHIVMPPEKRQSPQVVVQTESARDEEELKEASKMEDARKADEQSDSDEPDENDGDRSSPAEDDDDNESGEQTDPEDDGQPVVLAASVVRKLRIADTVDLFIKCCNLHITVSDCAPCFGPASSVQDVVPSTVMNALKDTPILVPETEEDVADLLYIKDYCKAVDLILHKGVSGETYFVGAEPGRPSIDIVKQVCDVLDMRWPREDKQSYHHLIELQKDAVALARPKSAPTSGNLLELGWKPEYSVESAIEDTVLWYLHRKRSLTKPRAVRAGKPKKRLYVRLMACFLRTRAARRDFRVRYMWKNVCPPPPAVAVVKNALVRAASLFIWSSEKRRQFRQKHMAPKLVDYPASYTQGSPVRDALANCFGKMFPDKRKRRILVVLHLYYMASWPEIRSYLKTLAPYNYDLILTYTDTYTQEVLDQVKEFKPDTRFMYCENRGFDVAPFLQAIEDIDLNEYDIVYKLHSKGIRRPFIFIYNQAFSQRDWFLNLFNGVFGLFRTRKVVNMLTDPESKVGLVAAENLIVQDPIHKQHFTIKIAEELGVPVKEGYKYIAGTCFAVRSKLLQPIKDLGMKLTDFAEVQRGTFSLAHGMERIVCTVIESQGYEFGGLPVSRRMHRRKTRKCRARSAMRLQQDPRFVIDDEFFYKYLETRPVNAYEVTKVRLGDIRRNWLGALYKLQECSPFKYLQGDSDAYDRYCQENAAKSMMRIAMTPERYEALKKSIADNDFDERFMPIVNKDNVILDGQHRCCILLHKYGEDHEITVLRLL